MRLNHLISVIVPVYNTEPFLPRCLDSIIGQTYRNLQIILVDDGSRDRCGKICDEYARKDERVEVIHQQNSGVVTARNAGLSLAKGDYLAFVDSDDWIEPDMYEKLIVLASASPFPDMVYCNVVNEYEDGQRNVYKVPFNSDYELMIGSLLRVELYGSLYNLLIKELFYDSSNIKTDPDCGMFEDTNIILQLLYNRPSLDYVDSCLYHYNCQNALSAVSKCDSWFNQCIIGIPNLVHMQDFLVDRGIFDRYRADFRWWCMAAKIEVLRRGGMAAARRVLPLTHKPLSAFMGMKFPIACIYWFGFNGGYIGKWVFELYNNLVVWLKERK